jgi:hypothetical protein
MIAFEQRFGRGLAQHAVELPAEIFGVLQPRIGATRAERRHLVGGIPGKDHPAMDKPGHAPALKPVERNPFEIELIVAEHARNPRPHVFLPFLRNRVGIAIKLQVDAPDIVRLLVQQRGSSGVERWIEPEPPFGRKLGRHLDVGNQELVLEHLPGKVCAYHLPQRRARPVAGDDISGADAI